MYRVEHSGPTDFVRRLSDMASIPMVHENSDYQAFLEWLAEGNTPEPWPPAE